MSTVNNSELYSELRPYIHSDEEILWIGKPTSSKPPKNAILDSVFAAFFMVFAMLWMAIVSTSGGFGSILFIFGIPIWLVGIGIIYNATLGRTGKLKKCIYAVTQTRAIILQNHPRKGVSCKEYVFSELSNINLQHVRGTVGTIRFEEMLIYHEYYGRRRSVRYSVERELSTAFIMINDVQEVYHLISERLGRKSDI